MDQVEKLQRINREMLDETDEHARPKDIKFDHWPLIEGASVPLRRHVSAPDGSDMLSFYLTSGDGEIEGVPVFVRGEIGCSMEIEFRPSSTKAGDLGPRYYISVQDMIKHAYEQFKRDQGAKL